MIIPLFIYVLALVLLIACWVMGDVEFRTKVILTGLYLLTWPLIFIDGWAVVVGQCVIAGILWFVTFGPSKR